VKFAARASELVNSKTFSHAWRLSVLVQQIAFPPSALDLLTKNATYTEGEKE
jgi:hypothetical protein